jgi:hypothetical protein
LSTPGGITVAKVGRNDPCPCGSGKKYKHCCLLGETAAKSEVISTDRAWRTMTDKLLAFSREPRFGKDLASAFDLFWNRSHALEEADSLDPVRAMNFLDWYVHDYSTSPDGRRIVEIFLTERGPTLSEQELELLQAAQHSLLSACEVTSVEEGKTIKLVDVFQDLEYEVPYSPAPEGISEGQLLLARLVTARGVNRFSWISGLVPPEAEEDLKAYTRDMFARYQEDHYQAPWGEFLQERSYLFNHFMLKVKGELPAPKVSLPVEQKEGAEPRPLVLTPQSVETKERPPVLVPGQKDGEPPSRVLVPGRDG